MSNFLSSKLQGIAPYVPGEQPQNRKFIKLNTNESPFAPSQSVQLAVDEQKSKLNLYPDPCCTELHKAFAEAFGVSERQVLTANGSDEVLSFAFLAFCENGVAFADITYGFYKVFARLYGVDAQIIPLNQELRINVNDYKALGKTVILANPNAPTGIALSAAEVESIVKSNPKNLVIVDEAYVDFGAESVVKLTNKYDNLLVVGTFSKSRSLAGARLGYAVGNESLIDDLNKIKYSINPYNVNRMTMAAGAAALQDQAYYGKCIREIIETREWFVRELKSSGFSVLDSKANFVFAEHNGFSAKTLYERLKEEGVLVRWFDAPRISEFLRITIARKAEMQVLLDVLRKIFNEG